MKQTLSVSTMALALLAPGLPLPAAQPFAGRWDLTVTTPKDSYPSWMEFTTNGGQPQVRVVGRVASVHPATDVKLDGSRLSFTTSEWFDGQIKVTWEFQAAGGKLTGSQKRADGVEGKIVGVPAPPLKRNAPAAWTKPEPLFDSQDLNGWEPDDPANNHWAAQDSQLVNQAAGANIRTARKFGDFKLHIEYNCPQDGNSGVYLRGRYEVQVEYEKPSENDKFHAMGSIYGFLAPAVEIAKRPGQWESYDVTLVGRTVTVVRDGRTTIDHQEIPGITGGAIDSREGEPGPLYIQGDHTGGMKYRNITISVPEK
ncbi:MAG: DUF1080 domain-containing protein [Bryobacteraceae bacterium]